jgi:hypothetical protein
VTFLFRPKRWRLSRIMRVQICWDPRRHAPIYAYEVTISNGAFNSYARHRWAVVAWLIAHYKRNCYAMSGV